MKLISLKIGTRLILGFGIVVILTTLFGLMVLTQIRTLSSFTEDMHNHPMAVSNSVRNIQTHVATIRFYLQKYINENDEEEYRNLFTEIHILEDEIEANFKVIRERFLGDMTDVDRAYSTFSELVPVLDSILSVSITGNKEGAVTLFSNGNVDYTLQRLSEQVVVMSSFAHGKSEEFYSNAKQSAERIFSTTIIFLVITMILCIIIGSFISFSVTSPLSKLILMVKEMAVGNNDSVVEIDRMDEIGALADSLNEMRNNLLEVVIHAGKIAAGDYSGSLNPRSDKDHLSNSLNVMTDALEELEGSNAYQDWLKTGQNLLNDEMRGDLETADLAGKVITAIASYVQAQAGALYLFDQETNSLRLMGSFAYSLRKGLSDSFQLGEGLVGQVGREKQLISITDAPSDYMRIISGLGSREPQNIIAFPFLLNDELKGVIELGAFKYWNDKEIELFNTVSEMIAVSFNSSETRHHMRELMENELEQSKELKAANEELEEKTERLLLSEERLKTQQEELKATNEELEEKTEHLEKQRDEINRKNLELQIVQEEIVQKAEDLENSSRYKSEFMANMSHELRTPLNSLLILAKDLANNKGDRLSEDDVQSAQIIYNSGTELLQLINEILDLAKIESGKMTLDLRSFSISEMATYMKDLFQSIAENKSLDFSISVADDFPETILSDRQKLSQILKNLLSNAFKFTIDGKVTLSFRNPSKELLEKAQGDFDKKSLLLEVRDTGLGIPEDMLEGVFDAFKQVDGSSSREHGGTGLGLSISRELASLLNGEILLDSEMGKGSTFSLLLPRELEEQVLPEVEKTEEGIFLEDDRQSLGKGDKSILIVEDDRNFATVLKGLCRKQNFKTIITDKGEEGITLAEQFKPQAIILDIKLPGINGLQVLDHLKKNKTTRHIPVHMMSIEDRESEVLEKGVLGFIQKPVSMEALNEMFSDLEEFLKKGVKDLLIVEDNDNLRLSIEKLIGNHDVAKTSVGNGKDALKALKEKKFDCMILDLTLPDISGFDLLKMIEEREDLQSKPPVIIYTGKEISYEEEFELRKYTSSVIIKGVHSEERLLDETSLFLHRVIDDLPEQKQELISKVYNQELVFQDKTVLAVDDDMRNLYAVAKILEEQGVKVVKAVDGRKALDVLEEQGDRLDLILMDIMMPVMDGYETIKEIRKDRKYHSLPILALTAKAMKEDRARCLEAGANDYMMKPIDPERLLSLMRVWLYK